ncbi:hypothetical protein FHT40_001755 [Mycolicibacterium sp. BK556]|uniref:DUF7802 domain-containing protein n=1 Tax=unclassified Mycolicibacterium TaxID=2636767 RepID=UPI00160BB836|nr:MULTISPECIES: hypothetical protein [unclassified Mycolicibacterium]MBB3602122.1 hypothetical protein [Mycolicibacterium sp. BK556]MBB3631874.1 hypothetical protein [Mycolicibacterium sp. BK607]
MAEQCTAAFDAIARPLGDFTCQNAPAFIHLRNPLALSNWTLPVLELMMVTGAVLALIYSIRRLRRHGDPINLALWCATVVYLFVIEIPLYFPNIFGIQDQLGVVFAHNVFTVEFLFDRLPLYIVALYPAVVTLAYEIVRSLGIFRDRGVVVGAICVGFVHHCLYEVFDQLGPQLRWWAWNTDNPINHPLFTSVPMTSVFIFATLGPIVVTLLVMLLVGRKRSTGWSLTWRTLVAGFLVPLGLTILSIPTSLFGGDKPNTTAQAIVFAVELVVVAVIAVPVLARQWLGSRDDREPSEFVRIFGPIYLVVLGALWISALGDYFAATNGVTADGTPTGSLLYTVACFVVSVLAVLSNAGATKRASTSRSSRTFAMGE